MEIQLMLDVFSYLIIIYVISSTHIARQSDEVKDYLFD